MIRRTTVEIDEELLERAKCALGGMTTRAAVEEGPRTVVETRETEQVDRAARQRAFLKHMGDHLDLDVSSSDEMWR